MTETEFKMEMGKLCGLHGEQKAINEVMILLTARKATLSAEIATLSAHITEQSRDELFSRVLDALPDGFANQPLQGGGLDSPGRISE